MHLAAAAHAEGLGDEDGIGIARGEVGLGEAIERGLAGRLVDREVVALLEPGLEAELNLAVIAEAEGPDLGLELLDDGAIPALDGAAAFADVGRAVPERDAEMGAGEGELVGAVGGAIIDVEGLGETALEDGLFEAGLERGDLLGGVPRGVGDELGEVIDDRAEWRVR
jgi:hypothetical protein